MLKKNHNQLVHLKVDDLTFEGTATMPEDMVGIIIFALTNAKSRFSPLNTQLAQRLHDIGIGSLLVDLLTSEESLVWENRYDAEITAQRLEAFTNWAKLKTHNNLPIGYFVVGTAAGAAIKAAIAFDKAVKAMVIQSGRFEQTLKMIQYVKTSTLLIVGGDDKEGRRINEQAYIKLPGIKKLEIVEGTGITFDDEIATERLLTVSVDWFLEYLCPDRVPDRDGSSREFETKKSAIDGL